MSKKLVSKPTDCSDFQLCNLLLLPGAKERREKLIDFTEHKLRRMVRATHDAGRRRSLLDILADYQQGKIAVAWQGGNNPIYIKLDKYA